MARRRQFVELHLAGFEDVNRRLQAIPDVLRNKVVMPSLRAGARLVADRVRFLAPMRSGRLRSGPWSLRTFTNRRKHTRGVRVVSPTRATLGIADDAPGFYPFSMEFGWRSGRGVVGPLNLGRRLLKKNKAGKFYRANEFSAVQARQSLNQFRRKIAGKRFMHAALFGGRAQVLAAVAAEAYRQIGKLEIKLNQARQSGQEA